MKPRCRSTKKHFPNADAATLSDKKKVTTAVLDKLAEQHPDDNTIVATAEKAVVETTEFVKKKNLVRVPDKPLKVIVMPEFRRGQGIAYCDSPGPLEKNGETFYACEPTPKDWTKERKESFYREYNNHMVRDLTVHEAMPGHYPAIGALERIPGADVGPRDFPERHVYRGLGGLHRADDGRSRLWRARGEDAAVEDAAPGDLQRDPRPEHPYREHERTGSARPDDEGRLSTGRRSRREMETRPA